MRPMLNEWIGRQERAEDEVTLAAVRRLAALLDSPAQPRRREPIPQAWYIVLFNPTTPQSALRPDGHAAKGLFLPPVPLPRRMFSGRRTAFHEPPPAGYEATRASPTTRITPNQGSPRAMCSDTSRPATP